MERQVEAVLDTMGLTHHADVAVHALPYGEKRRAEIGVALATGPNVLLLDEPLAGMSPAERMTTRALIRELAQSRTLVIVEHDMDAVFELAERITVLYDGRLLADGPRSRFRATSPCRTPISGGYMNTSLLELDRVNTYYGDSHILFDVSLQVRQHEVVALLGRNGAGKTTTLRTIMGVLSARSRQHPPRRQADRTAAVLYDRAHGTAAGAGGAGDLRPAYGRGEPEAGGPDRAAGVAARPCLRVLSSSGGAAAFGGQAAIGRRAADAGHRARADP